MLCLTSSGSPIPIGLSTFVNIIFVRVIKRQLVASATFLLAEMRGVIDFQVSVVFAQHVLVAVWLPQMVHETQCAAVKLAINDERFIVRREQRITSDVFLVKQPGRK
jgi:hypothetical protein